MRKILILSVILVVVSSSFFAGLAFSLNRPKSTERERLEFAAVLRALRPTQAEINAVSQMYQPIDRCADKSVCGVESLNAYKNKLKVRVECRLLSMDETTFKTVLETPEMYWNSTLSPKKKRVMQEVFIEVVPRMPLVPVHFPVPEPITERTPDSVFVRFLDSTHCSQFLSVMPLSNTLNMLQAPTLCLESGQTGSVCDIVKRPFVTGVTSEIDAESKVTIHPVSQTFETGVKLRLQITIREDDSCYLDECYVVRSEIGPGKEYQLGEGENAIMVQIPELQQLIASFSDLTIPRDMSLLAVFPSWQRTSNGRTLAVLLTPQCITDDGTETEEDTSIADQDDLEDEYIFSQNREKLEDMLDRLLFLNQSEREWKFFSQVIKCLSE
ncbi:MAG: hypothetical protein ACRC10_10090 [Thermoguttaceae bacterium]